MKEKYYLLKRIIIKKKEIILCYEDNDKEEELAIHPSVFSDFYLYEGKKIEYQEFQEIKRMNHLAKDLDLAYRLLAKKEYSLCSFKKKLKEKKVASSSIERIVSIVLDHGLINDEQYALDLKEMLEVKLYGKYYILEALKKDGIEEKIIASFVFDEEKEEEKMKTLLPLFLRKWAKESSKKKYYHMYNEYLRRGYDSELVSAFLSLNLEKNDEDEFNNCLIEKRKVERIYQSKYQGYELKQRIIASLMRKGFSYDIIKQVIEEE